MNLKRLLFGSELGGKQAPHTEEAAGDNDARAQFLRGFSYAYGVNVAKDELEGVKWFRKAAEQNLAEAQSMLGTCYDNGRGVAQDYAEAAKWFRKAAEQNHVEAQNNLGIYYNYG